MEHATFPKMSEHSYQQLQWASLCTKFIFMLQSQGPNCGNLTPKPVQFPTLPYYFYCWLNKYNTLSDRERDQGPTWGVDALYSMKVGKNPASQFFSFRRISYWLLSLDVHLPQLELSELSIPVSKTFALLFLFMKLFIFHSTI